MRIQRLAAGVLHALAERGPRWPVMEVRKPRALGVRAGRALACGGLQSALSGSARLLINQVLNFCFAGRNEIPRKLSRDNPLGKPCLLRSRAPAKGADSSPPQAKARPTRTSNARGLERRR